MRPDEDIIMIDEGLVRLSGVKWNCFVLFCGLIKVMGYVWFLCSYYYGVCIYCLTVYLFIYVRT